MFPFKKSSKLPKPAVAQAKELHPIRQAQSFVEASKQFEQFRSDDLRSSRAIAWRVAAGMGICTILSLLALTANIVTRTDPEPWLIKVDNNTGFTSSVQYVRNANVQDDDIMNKHWLSRYVTARESYDWFFIQKDYKMVSLMSMPNVGAEYERTATGKGSPVETLKDKGKIEAKVTSISFVGKVAQVRFDKTKLNADGSPSGEPTTKWIATVSFSYGKTALSEVERLVNPLDFKVYGYRLDPEAAQ
jgi:type IV secretion system protein VirB8